MDFGMQGAYYFRIVGKSSDRSIVEKIIELRHEIGYYYEDIDLAARGIQHEVWDWRIRDQMSKCEEVSGSDQYVKSGN
jgi:hypothetical protein